MWLPGNGVHVTTKWNKIVGIYMSIIMKRRKKISQMWARIMKMMFFWWKSKHLIESIFSVHSFRHSIFGNSKICLSSSVDVKLSNSNQFCIQIRYFCEYNKSFLLRSMYNRSIRNKNYLIFYSCLYLILCFFLFTYLHLIFIYETNTHSALVFMLLITILCSKNLLVYF